MAAPSSPPAPPPDELRCRRSDGRGWRCKRSAIPDYPNCELHLSEAQRRRFESGGIVAPSRPGRRKLRPVQIGESLAPDPPTPSRRGRPRKIRQSDPVEPILLADLVKVKLPKRKRGPRVPLPHENLSLRDFPTSPVTSTCQNRFLADDSGVGCNPTVVPLREAIPAEGEAEDRALEDRDKVDATAVVASMKRRRKREVVGCFREVPEELQCRRTDGKRWRCRRPVVEGHYYCNLHRIQAYRRQHKLAVPDMLKLRRGRPRVERKMAFVAADDIEAKEVKRKKWEEMPLASLLRRVMKRKGKVKKEAAAVAPKVVSSRIVDDLESVPEHLRCRRTDGRQWRCSRRALDHLSFCEVHHIQAYRRQYKLGVPDHLKLKRKPRGLALGMGRLLGKRREDMDDDELRRAMKKDKRRKENETLLVEVMRLILQRQMEKRRRREQKRREELAESGPKFVKKILPNGVMSISPVVPGSSNYVGKHLDMKVGLDSSSFLSWCFRSKNVDSPPVGPLQRLPYARKALGLGKRRRRVCHHCRTNPVSKTLKCSSCRKTYFCKRCIKKWYSELSESDVRTSCPICRGECRCPVCSSSKAKSSVPVDCS